MKLNILSLSVECMRKDTNKIGAWKWSHIELHEISYPYLQTHSQSTASTHCDWCACREWRNDLGRYRVSNQIFFIFMKMPSWTHLALYYSKRNTRKQRVIERKYVTFTYIFFVYKCDNKISNFVVRSVKKDINVDTFS